LIKEKKAVKSEDKLPGRIIKILRDRNSVQQPTYFVLQKPDGTKSFATIEF